MKKEKAQDLHFNKKRPIDDGIEKPKSLLGWPGYILKKIGAFSKRLSYIVSLVWSASPALLIAMVALCLFDGILPLLGALVSKELLNEVAKLIGAVSLGSVAEDIFVTMRPLVFLFVLHFTYLLMRKILQRLNTMVTGIAGELCANHIRVMIMKKARDTDLACFDRPEFYEKLENANREAGMRPIQILSSSFGVVSAFISCISFILVLWALSPIVPIVIIAVAIPGALVNYIYRNRSFRYIRWHSKERREMNYYSGLMVNKDMAKEIKLLGLGDTFLEKYDGVFKKYYRGLKSIILKEGATQLGVGLFSTLANCLLLVFVAYRVIFAGDGEIGDYSLYSGALTSITGYVATLLTSTATIYEGTLFINNMMEFMSEERKILPNTEKPLLPTRGVQHTVEFVGVSFKYPGSERYVLRDINLKFSGYDRVVLVGLNGAGKTTLIKLLTRLYDPTEGKILLDGEDIRSYSPEALYSIFGIVFQDFGKYSQTVKENIAFGDVGKRQSDGDIILSATRADADGFIDKLPLGYETPLTRVFEEDGVELSGGQWQRLSVARAFYKDSEILILDEPTASLDAIAEKEVYDRFSELASDRMSIFVSHRLSSAVDADKIVVIGEGKILEMGSHDELMARGGEYYRLFSTQAENYLKSANM